MTAALVTAAVCLVLEAFFSGSEIAVVAADRLRIRQGAEAGDRSRRLLQSFLATPQRLLATTLVGTQVAIVTSTVTVTLALAHRMPMGRAELLTLACLTPVLVVIGEIVPKSLAQQNADRVAPVLVYPLWVASLLFAPLVFGMVRFTGWVSRVLGIEAPRKLVSREDLELAVQGASARGDGEITEGERTMISRILDFSEVKAVDIMVPLSSVAALDEGLSIEQAVREAEDKHHTRFPIYKERIDRIVGIVHTFDLLQAGRREATVGSLMHAPIYVPEGQPAVDLLVVLQRERQGMAVVVDEYGGAVGVVTIEDVLEEIVGEIEDEYDTAPPAIRKQPDGAWRVRGPTPIEEVNRQLQVALPESDDYETLAGLLLDRLKRIPRPGEIVRLDGVVLKVVDASERAIEDVEIRLPRRR